MRHLCGVTVLLVPLLGLAIDAEAVSLKVSPGRFTIHNVEPGREHDLYGESGVRVTIFNEDEAPRTWALSTRRPSPSDRWEKGYAEIPEARWCWPEHSEVTVGPKARGYVNLHLKVPDEERYYNQHWVAILAIGSKPGSGAVGVAVSVRILIETQGKAGLTTRPDGLLGLEPSIVRFEDTRPGGRKKAQVEIFNNDVRAHGYTISSLLADAETDQKTYLTHSYQAIPDFTWVKHDKTFQIEPGKSAAFTLDLEIPDDEANFGKRWEDVLLVQPDDGRARLVRVQVQTTEKVEVE